jgi:hypothetical protein
MLGSAMAWSLCLRLDNLDIHSQQPTVDGLHQDIGGHRDREGVKSVGENSGADRTSGLLPSTPS